eukprot:1962417-Prymnesium_polylepis.1
MRAWDGPCSPRSSDQQPSHHPLRGAGRPPWSWRAWWVCGGRLPAARGAAQTSRAPTAACARRRRH